MPVKTVFAPHLNRHVKLGRVRPKPGRPKFHFSKYATSLPAPPATVSYSAAATAALAEMYMNDSLGDCVIAGGYHLVGVWTGNASGGKPFLASQAQILADYGAIGGYVPGDPSTDNGCDEDTAEQYWTTHGFADGTKLLGAIAVDATNQTQVMQAVDLFENCYLGLELPDTYVNPFPSAPGFTWGPGTPDPNNGHCIVAVGYTAAGLTICTWGMLGTLTWAALAQLCVAQSGGQLSVMLSPDQLAKGQAKAPNGFAWAALLADFNAMGGNVPVPAPAPAPAPSPSPSPSPSPAPAAGPTLAQVTAAITPLWKK
jgi:hypothetical protein